MAQRHIQTDYNIHLILLQSHNVLIIHVGNIQQT